MMALLILAFVVYLGLGIPIHYLKRLKAKLRSQNQKTNQAAYWTSFICFAVAGLIAVFGFLFFGLAINPPPVHPLIVFMAMLLFVFLIYIGIEKARRIDPTAPPRKTAFIMMVMSGFFVFILSGLGFFVLLAGMGWGRPLRIRGKIVRPRLKDGDDWCLGERPDATDVDEKTREALEALWLHDAQKEYASVPAFSRLTWQMISLGAPPDLIRDLHLAGLQEIDHTKKCFALAAGFGAQAKTILPLPEMMHGFDNVSGDPAAFLAVDSLIDGCLLEGFNADTASESAKICQDPASLKVIRQIVREERFHADLSWRVLQFCFECNPETVKAALLKEIPKIRKIARPTAFSSLNQKLVEQACPQTLIRYGRLPDSEFDALWERRVAATELRLKEVLNGSRDPQGPRDQLNEVAI